MLPTAIGLIVVGVCFCTLAYLLVRIVGLVGHLVFCRNNDARLE